MVNSLLSVIMSGFIVKNHLFETNKLTDATTGYRYRIKNSHKAMVLNYKTNIIKFLIRLDPQGKCYC